MELVLYAPNLNRFEQVLEKVNKSLKKVSMPCVVLKETCIVTTKAVDSGKYGVEVQQTACEYENALNVMSAISPEYKLKGYKITVEVPAELVKHEGWQVIGRLEKLAAGNIITPVVDDTTDFSTYRSLDYVPCHHCSVKSTTRKRGWIVRHDDGREIVVGDACCKEYFGVDIANTLKACEYLSLLGGDQGSEDSSRTARHFAYAELTMRLAIFEILENGFAPKRMEELSTSTRVREYLSLLVALRLSDAEKEEKAKLMQKMRERYDQLESLFNEMMKWYETTAFTDDFMENVKVAALSYSYKHSGLLIMAAYNYLKEVGLAYKSQVGSEKAFTQAFFGSVGTKFDGLHVTLRRIKVLDTAFGTCTLYTFQDDDGNGITWKSSNSLNLTVSHEYILKGTVKEHSIWKDMYITYVTRCKVLPYVSK